MTEPEDNHSNTRPISVAELLARNGSIGAPPVGGRRRRRRGDSNSVTVAELTGEIPIITDATDPEADAVAESAAAPENEQVEPEPPEVEQPEHVEESEADDSIESAADPAPMAEQVAPDRLDDAETTDEVPVTKAEADYEAHLEQREADDEPIEFTAPTRRLPVATPPGFSAPAGGAEQMSPDPVGDDDDEGPDVDLIESLENEAPLAARDDEATQAAFEVPSYLRSNSDTLFGGQSVADDLARRGAAPGPEDIDLGEDARPAADADVEPDQPPGSPIVRGAWVVVQCILAVAFGAGLFIAFDLLWKWNNIVALVLSVLVILGLVIGVRIVRKTEDVGSTLIAVAVGALVTLGPLALLQSH